MRRVYFMTTSFLALLVLLVAVFLWVQDRDRSRSVSGEGGSGKTVSTEFRDYSPEPVNPPEQSDTPRDPDRSVVTAESSVEAVQPYTYSDAERRYGLNRGFEAAALELLPVHTVQTHDPRNPEAFGPRENEVWLRIRVEAAPIYRDIMAEAAELYKELTYHEGPVTVMHWVGNRPYAKMSFPEEYE